MNSIRPHPLGQDIYLLCMLSLKPGSETKSHLSFIAGQFRCCGSSHDENGSCNRSWSSLASWVVNVVGFCYDWKGNTLGVGYSGMGPVLVSSPGVRKRRWWVVLAAWWTFSCKRYRRCFTPHDVVLGRWAEMMTTGSEACGRLPGMAATWKSSVNWPTFPSLPSRTVAPTTHFTVTTNRQTYIASLWLHCRCSHFRDEGRMGVPVSKSPAPRPGIKLRALHVAGKLSVTELYLLIPQASLW